MIVKYDQSQDITLKLTKEETVAILNGPTNNFFDIHITSKEVDPITNNHYILLRDICDELQAHFFLGYSIDQAKMFRTAKTLDSGFGKIILPEQIGDSWKINLSRESIEHFKRGWPYGIRYPGGSKLFIKNQNAMD